MLKLNLAVAIVFAMAATAHAQPSLSPGPAPSASGSVAPISVLPRRSPFQLIDACRRAIGRGPEQSGAARRADVDASAGH